MIRSTEFQFADFIVSLVAVITLMIVPGSSPSV